MIDSTESIGCGTFLLVSGNLGGMLLPRLENTTLRNLANNNDSPMMGAHLAHGASHKVPIDDTALP